MTAELRDSDMIGSGGITPLQIDEIDPSHPVRAFNETWESLAAAGEIPHRREFHPAMSPRVLPWLMVLERITTGNNSVHVIRLQGSSLTSIMGENWTGERIEDRVAARYLDERKREFDRLIETGKPVFSTAATPRKEREFIRQIRGMFLFRTDDPDRPQIFMVVAPVGERI